MNTTGRLRGFTAVLLLCLAWSSHAQSSTVAASQYDTFWVWAGVQSQPALAHARTVYLLDAEVRPGQPTLIAQRPALPHVKQADVWMVVRVETLNWSPSIESQVMGDLTRWSAVGNRVVGIQIDFDAHTRHLDTYAAFLKDLRSRLPHAYKLSITGLLDWSSHGDPRSLEALAGIVDEVVPQIYQGRHVIPGYESYLARLDRLKIPFRIGLLEGGEWHQPPGLAVNPFFRGYVVFLQNPRTHR